MLCNQVSASCHQELRRHDKSARATFSRTHLQLLVWNMHLPRMLLAMTVEDYTCAHEESKHKRSKDIIYVNVYMFDKPPFTSVTRLRHVSDMSQTKYIERSTYVDLDSREILLWSKSKISTYLHTYTEYVGCLKTLICLRDTMF